MLSPRRLRHAGSATVAGATGLLLLVGFSPIASSDHVQTGGGRVVVFDHLGVNEWWVELRLSGQDAGQVSGVQARSTGGAWTAMTWRPDWGKWAAGVHVFPGERVQFRATWSGGTVVDSCWFTHPAGMEQCVDPFDATFTMVEGNEWWVQAQVTPNAGHSVASVDVRLDDGAWKPLKLQTWGVREWAASYHMPEGTKVQLRATTTAGATDLSSCYRWIPLPEQDARQTPCAAFEATFKNVRGNEWWVEVDVVATHELAGVDARLGCSGTWTPLALRSWGSWAKSMHVTPGSLVDFRAHSKTGAMDVSTTYVWPQATPGQPCDRAWPRPESFADVRFRSEERWHDVDGAHYVLADGLVHTTYTGAAWEGTCEVRRSHQDGSGAWTNVTETWPWARAPPMGELPAPWGSRADAQTVQNCAFVIHPDLAVTEHRKRTFSLRSVSGDPIPITAVHAASSGTGFNENYWWDTQHGLMLEWDLDSIGGSNSMHADGWLLNTDATFV